MVTTTVDNTDRFPDWPKTDFTRTTIDLDEVLRGCPGPDCIPPLDAEAATDIPGERAGVTRFAAASTLALTERMPIVLVRVNGEVRGYPLHILTWHEIVTTRLAGCPSRSRSARFAARQSPSTGGLRAGGWTLE